MGKGVILFSGVHGVGKGYFIKENIKDNDDIICISASELIRQYQNSEDAGYKKVKDVEGNQEILLNALRCMEMSADKSILLDGHLCIINSNNEVETISESFILKAQIKGVILVAGGSSNYRAKTEGKRWDMSFHRNDKRNTVQRKVICGIAIQKV